MLRRGGRPGLIGMAARTAVVSGTATAVSGRVARRQQERYAQDQQERYAQDQQEQQQYAPPPPASSPAAPSADAPDLMSQLSRLASLHEQGVLTDEEFSAAKAKLLS